MCYLMTTFRCPSDILITSWLFTAQWSTWPGNYLVPCVAELVGSCIPIHAHQCLPDPNCLVRPKDKVKDEEKTELLQLLCWRDRQEVRSEDQETQERSGLFHSWYTDLSLQGKREQCSSQVTDHAVEENHVIDWDKAKVVDREAQRQAIWDKEAVWIRKTPMFMNRDAGS